MCRGIRDRYLFTEIVDELERLLDQQKLSISRG